LKVKGCPTVPPALSVRDELFIYYKNDIRFKRPVTSDV
jgi:hypothetical protein